MSSEHNKHSSSMHPKMEGFLYIGFHGAHSEVSSQPSAQVVIAKDTPDGQFETQFCSTACLRAFLNRCVDQLEQKLGGVNGASADIRAFAK